MTKEEFIEQAVLAMLHGDIMTPSQTILTKAQSLADQIYGSEITQASSSVLGKKCTEEIASFIDHSDKEERDKNQAKYQAHDFSRNWKAQKSGYARRFRSFCGRNDISTVQELLDFGRYRFNNVHGIGKKLTEYVDNALKTLYNIDAW